jgi:hypothetical protein
MRIAVQGRVGVPWKDGSSMVNCLASPAGKKGPRLTGRAAIQRTDTGRVELSSPD